MHYIELYGTNMFLFPYPFWCVLFLHHYDYYAIISCLQIARAFGASEIIAVDVQDEKLNNAKSLGATHTINAAKEDAVDKIKAHTRPFLYFPWIWSLSFILTWSKFWDYMKTDRLDQCTCPKLLDIGSEATMANF